MSYYTSAATIVHTDYLFLTAMLRARETRMASREKLEQMLIAPDFVSTCRIAADCGYPDMDEMRIREVEDALSARRHEEFEDVANMVPHKELLDLFRLKYDYHNAKTMIKSEGRSKELLSFEGRVEAADFLKIFMQKETPMLPEVLGEAIHEAMAMLSRTGNPCLSDLILDRAYFREMEETAARTGLPFAVNYVRLLIDTANLRILIRSKMAGKRPEIISELLFEGGSIAREAVIGAADTADAICQLFASAGLADAAEKGVRVLSGGSMTVFELAADNAVNDYLADAERIGFGPAVVISYLSAVENEVMSLRIILTGKLMGIGEETMRERLRESYV